MQSNQSWLEYRTEFFDWPYSSGFVKINYSILGEESFLLEKINNRKFCEWEDFASGFCRSSVKVRDLLNAKWTAWATLPISRIILHPACRVRLALIFIVPIPTYNRERCTDAWESRSISSRELQGMLSTYRNNIIISTLSALLVPFVYRTASRLHRYTRACHAYTRMSDMRANSPNESFTSGKREAPYRNRGNFHARPFKFRSTDPRLVAEICISYLYFACTEKKISMDLINFIAPKAIWSLEWSRETNVN